MAIAGYVSATVVSIFLAFVLSFLTVFAMNGGRDDSPGLGLLWIVVLSAEASLLTSLGLGLTAEFIERKVQVRPFRWSKALLRSLLALPIAIGPIYSEFYVRPFVEDHRPVHYSAKEVILYCVSGLFAYMALRIRSRYRVPDFGKPALFSASIAL
jgi:hypothetical protein